MCREIEIMKSTEPHEYSLKVHTTDVLITGNTFQLSSEIFHSQPIYFDIPLSLWVGFLLIPSQNDMSGPDIGEQAWIYRSHKIPSHKNSISAVLSVYLLGTQF